MCALAHTHTHRVSVGQPRCWCQLLCVCVWRQQRRFSLTPFTHFDDNESPRLTDLKGRPSASGSQSRGLLFVRGADNASLLPSRFVFEAATCCRRRNPSDPLDLCFLRLIGATIFHNSNENGLFSRSNGVNWKRTPGTKWSLPHYRRSFHLPMA